MTSKCDGNISDTVGYRLVCHFFVLPTFWRRLWSITEQAHSKNGIYLTIIQQPSYCAGCDWLMPVIYYESTEHTDDVTAWGDSRTGSEFIVQVSLLRKVFKNLQRKQQEKDRLNYKSTSRNNLPNTLHLSWHLTGLSKLEVDSDWFEKLSKAVSVCPMLE